MSGDGWLLLGLSGGAIAWVLIVAEDLLWEHGHDIYAYIFLSGGTK